MLSFSFLPFGTLPASLEPRTLAPPLTGWYGTAIPLDRPDGFTLFAPDAPLPLYNLATEHLLTLFPG